MCFYNCNTLQAAMGQYHLYCLPRLHLIPTKKNTVDRQSRRTEENGNWVLKNVKAQKAKLNANCAKQSSAAVHGGVQCTAARLELWRHHFTFVSWCDSKPLSRSSYSLLVPPPSIHIGECGGGGAPVPANINHIVRCVHPGGTRWETLPDT